jgi:hypothetical protein
MSFAQIAREPAAQLAELLLAIDEELTGCASPVALERLEALAASVAQSTDRSDPPQAQARVLATVLGRRACLRARNDEHPEGLLLTPALARGRAHPHLLTALYAQVAQWAGLPWEVTAEHGALALVHPDSSQVPFPRRDQPLQVLSPRGVTFVVLGALAQAFHRHLHLGQAVRAAELRLHLPVADCCRRRAQAQVRALSAPLN